MRIDANLERSTLSQIGVSLLLLAMLLTGNPVLANNTFNVAVEYSGEPLSVGRHFQFYEDSAAELELGDILLDRDFGERGLIWQSIEEDVPNFGYTDSVFWFRTAINNITRDHAQLVLSIDYPLLDQVDVFFLRDGKVVRSFMTGDSRPFSSRAIPHRKFVFPIALNPGQGTELYMRIASEGAVQVPAHVMDQERFFLEDMSELAIKCVYYGMMLVMVLYNLFLYASVREKAYLFYVGFVSCFALMQAAMHGVLFQVGYPGLPDLHQLSVLVLVPATMLFACLFSVSFLDLRSHSPVLESLLRWLVLASLMCVVGAFGLNYGSSTRISVLLVVVASLLMLVSGPVAWYRGQSSARYYTIAWLLLLVGTTSMALSKFAVLPSNLFTEYGLMIGSAAEAILLSFALADRLNGEKEARYLAQQEQLRATQERMRAEEALLYTSTHEAVTGLPNRVPLFECLDRLVSEKHVPRFAVVKVSMGRSDEVAKTLGHDNAEQIVAAFARRLCLKVESMSEAMAIIGDKQVVHYEPYAFLFLLELHHTAGLKNLLAHMRRELSAPIEYQDMLIDVGTLMGASIYPDHSDNGLELVKQAQIAMGFSEETEYIYDHSLNPYSERRLRLMGELQTAIEQNQLTLHFQPQLDVNSGRVVGAEALIRWNHPEYGYIPPMEFIPHAEQTGLIKLLTAWVFDHALFALRQLMDKGEEMDISINISAANLHETNLVRNIQAMLSKHNVPANRLKIEITETAIMLNPDNALRVLTHLHNIGVKIAVDDFGTGHSSLSYIKKLPADEIKIDRSFVTDMSVNPDDEVIVSTTISMCHNLGYSVVAEGIEDSTTLAKLAALECDVAQGYYHSRPLPFDDFQSWLATLAEQAPA
ncbi:MAG: EAL domain-containing protein [Oleiphilaceae bacterium]|nr:EAL domain-containing protein [Oleiphilaceae bacterium]